LEKDNKGQEDPAVMDAGVLERLRSKPELWWEGKFRPERFPTVACILGCIRDASGSILSIS
jgi:hypothetical protein